MPNKIHILKAILICAIINVIYTFYTSSGAFVRQLAMEGQEVGRIKAFIDTAKITEGFWSHIAVGWLYGFVLTLISCLLLLLWLKKENT